MKVSFFATLRDVTGAKTIDFDLPECATVQQLINTMIARFPDLKPVLLQENGDLWGHVHIFINGRDARFLDQNLNQEIKSSDAISVFPAVGGG